MPQRLIDGLHEFRREHFGRHEELFRHLAEQGQRPDALFIACSDSRVMPAMLTRAKPGDLFMVRNVGNLVPPPDGAVSPGSTAAAIEFAVEVLGVDDVVVCGHSHCGAMQALLGGVPASATMGHLARWLEVAAPVREIVERHYGHLTDRDARANAAAQENVLHALDTLRLYPALAQRLREGRLRLHAWFLKIETAELYGYDPAQHQFAPLAGGRGTTPIFGLHDEPTGGD
jgi:carbonic anhydrase